MRHLEKEGVFHRDLALRNLLVGVQQGTEKYCIKISGKFFFLALNGNHVHCKQTLE
jgi:hypothetical protein